MSVHILRGDVREKLAELPDASVHCVVTSPPYWGLRDYGVSGQIGLESSPADYVETMVAVFREVRRVLRDDGTLWLNLGDSYSQSGRGGNPDDSPHRKQATNAGSISVGRGSQLQAGLHESARQAGAVSRAWSGKAPEGLKPKDLVGIPWRVAFALQADGWYLRQDIIWAKPNPMPESVRDRCTKAHEYIFMLSKSARYHYDPDAIAEPASRADWAYETATTPGNADRKDGGCTQRKTDKRRGHSRRHAGFNDRRDAMEKDEQCSGMRNKRSVWTVATHPFAEAHFATFPPALIEPCILAGCPPGGVVLDPFGGAGTTGLVADRHGRDAILIELNPQYADMAERRIKGDSPLFAEVS